MISADPGFRRWFAFSINFIAVSLEFVSVAERQNSDRLKKGTKKRRKFLKWRLELCPSCIGIPVLCFCRTESNCSITKTDPFLLSRSFLYRMAKFLTFDTVLSIKCFGSTILHSCFVKRFTIQFFHRLFINILSIYLYIKQFFNKTTNSKHNSSSSQFFPYHLLRTSRNAACVEIISRIPNNLASLTNELFSFLQTANRAWALDGH